jgi:hypothetical protein
VHLVVASALAQVDAARRGIHLFWSGPPAFLFSPEGWRVERRQAKRPDVNSVCDVLDTAGLARLRHARQLRTAQGLWMWREGRWPDPTGTKAEILTFDFTVEHSSVHGDVQAQRAFILGMRGKKAVTFAGPLTQHFSLGTAALERVVIYAIAPTHVSVCVRGDDAVEWTNATVIRERLQVPLGELMPALTTPQAEFAEAKSRLLPGEELTEERFGDFADTLRVALRDLTTPPIRRTLLMRDETTEPFEELSALDPIRMVYADPMWRRVLGLALFDDDPALIPGQSYDYRVIGRFPASMVLPRWYGFHTIPSGTPLPSEFYLDDAMIRTAQPTTVQRAPDVDENGVLLTSRRCLPLAPRDESAWFGIGIEDASAVIDFGEPVTSVVLDVAEGHTLRYQAGHAWIMTSPDQPVPPGPQAVLTFTTAVTELRLFGRGALFGFWTPATVSAPPDGMLPLAATVLGVMLADAPRPAPPLSATAVNLQSNAPVVPGTIPARHELGMEVRWVPAPSGSPPLWPPDENVLPPLDATTFQLERRVDPTGSWLPVVSENNRVLGTITDQSEPLEPRPGMDLMQIFAEIAPNTSPASDMRYRDVFLTATPEQRAAIPPGTMLAYRIRAVDVVGRPSLTWTQTAPARLEKHIAPPVPAAPEEVPADTLTTPAPTGVRARAIVAGDPALTPADRGLLGTSDNVVVLNWGWHEQQRRQDSFAQQFRIYLARPLDAVDGQVQSVTPVPATPGLFTVALQLARQIAADAARGLYLDAGSPFFIETHTAGAAVQATVRTRIPLPNGSFRTPEIGPVPLPLRLSSALTRPSGWAERLEVTPGQRFMPITDALTYQFVVRDRLELTETHPRDEIWLGVSAADAEPYVPDTFPNPSPGPLPGNESSVAMVSCQAATMRYPSYSPPHGLQPVPRIRAPEPVNGEVRFVIDLAPYLDGMGLTSADPIRPERLDAQELLAALAVRNNRLFATVVNRRAPNESEQEIVLPNPSDQAALIAAIETGDADRVDDRFVTYLAGIHRYADRLFTAATSAPVPFATFTDVVPPGGRRYVYRVKKANAAGRLSRAGAIAKVIVRVPSLMPGPPPRREARQPGDAVETFRLSIPRDDRLQSVLIFQRVLTVTSELDRAQMIRLPNRSDVAPGDAVRLRTPDGLVATPTVVDVEPAPDPAVMLATVSLTPEPGGRAAVWACSLTIDGIPSALAGPWVVHFPTP